MLDLLVVVQIEGLCATARDFPSHVIGFQYYGPQFWELWQYLDLFGLARLGLVATYFAEAECKMKASVCYRGYPKLCTKHELTDIVSEIKNKHFRYFGKFRYIIKFGITFYVIDYSV